MQGDLYHPPIVIRSARDKFAFIALAGALLEGFLLWTILFRPAGDWSLAHWYLAHVLVWTTGFFIAVCLAALIVPAKVTISPGGVEIRVFFRHTRCDWPKIGPAAIDEADRAGLFELATFEQRIGENGDGVLIFFPVLLEVGPRQLVDLVYAARERWSA